MFNCRSFSLCVAAVTLFFGAFADETAERMNNAGFALLQKVAEAKPNENALISPYSVDSAFGMLCLGAKGETDAEIRKALGLPADLTAFKRYEKGLTQGKATKVLTSNSIWLDRKWKLLADYTIAAEGIFGATANEVDFSNGRAAVGEINGFVEKKTEGMIRNLLAPENVSGNTEAVLVNTLYFKCDWSSPFPRKRTRKEPFHLLDGTDRPVDMMHDKRFIPYAERNGVKAIRIPYKDLDYSFIAVLPPEGLAPVNLLADFAKGGFARIMKEMTSEEIAVSLPRLDVDFRASLLGPLKDSGVRAAFADAADISGITGRPLKVSDVIHATKLKVDEVSTEAAAATAIVMERCARPPVRPPKTFRADRPFFAAIVDRKSGLVLFAGIINIVDGK